jgi:hypothetical protein
MLLVAAAEGSRGKLRPYCSGPCSVGRKVLASGFVLVPFLQTFVHSKGLLGFVCEKNCNNFGAEQKRKVQKPSQCCAATLQDPKPWTR